MGLSIDQDIAGTGGEWTPPLVQDAFSRIGACGKSFGRGIFKFHDSVSGPAAADLLPEAFPRLAGGCDPFAFDWLGRQYAVIAPTMTPSGAAEVVVLDAFDMTVTPVVQHGEFLGFLSSPLMLELVDAQLFAEWLAASGRSEVGFDRCASAIHPGFLGGVREVQNLEDADIEVYWSVMIRAFKAAGALQPGERLARFEL